MSLLLKYKPTILQKILRRHYKWWYLFAHGIKANSAYFISDIFWFIGRLVGVFSLIYLFHVTNNSASRDLNILNNLFASIYGFQIVFILSSQIQSGKLSSWLLMPTSLRIHLFIYGLGVGLRSIFINLFIFLFLAFVVQTPLDIGNLFLTLIFFTPTSLTIFFNIEYIIGSIAFWTINNYGVNEFYQQISYALSGLLIPLILLPPWLEFLPFAYLTHHSVQFYLGNYDTNQALLVFAGGVVWCIVLYFLAKLVFKMGLKRNEAVGL